MINTTRATLTITITGKLTDDRVERALHMVAACLSGTDYAMSEFSGRIDPEQFGLACADVRYQLERAQ